MADNYTQEVEERLRKEAAEVVARYPQPRSAIMPLLHLIQSEDGFVSPRGVVLIADILDLSRAQVSAIATFYSQYRRHPNGEYNVGVCTNALCAVMGGDLIWQELSSYLGIGHDETTDDGKITLEQLECNAGCDYAPVIMVNWEFFDNRRQNRLNSSLMICVRAKVRIPRAVLKKLLRSKKSNMYSLVLKMGTLMKGLQLEQHLLQA